MTAKTGRFRLTGKIADVKPERLQIVVVVLLLILAGALTVAVPQAGTVIPIGNLMVSFSHGMAEEFTPAGTRVQTLNSGHGEAATGSAFDRNGNFWLTIFDAGLTEFDPSGALIGDAAAPSAPESILFDSAGNIYLGQPDGTRQILKLNATASTQLAAFSARTEDRGTDWIDLAADECTMFYTSEGVNVQRFNVCTNAQLANFNAAPLPGTKAFALRILPKDIGRLPAGSVLVADTSEVAVLDNRGNRVRDDEAVGTEGGIIFALNLDPDGTSYWTADALSGEVFRVDIATGAIITNWNAAVGEIGGLSVKGQITAVPTPTPTPSGAMVIPPPAVPTIVAGPGATATSGTFMLRNTGGNTLVASVVSISFSNADLFSSATLTATIGPNTSAATVNPVEGGNSPEQPNNTAFLLEPPLVIPAGQTAEFNLTVRVTTNPQLTKGTGPLIYAATLGRGAFPSNAFVVALALLEMCAAVFGTVRRSWVLVTLLLLMTLASQVGCGNGSGSGGTGASSAAVHSTQTAIQVETSRQENNEPVVVTGLPVVMGSVVIK